MSDMLTDQDEPEAPTNRPPSIHRLQDWARRPYARHIMILTVVIGFLLLPAAWGLLAAMNQTGAPASQIMVEIQKTIFVFTIVSIPITAFVLAVLIYSLLGWPRVSGDEPPLQESPAIRNNIVAVMTWTIVSSLLAVFLVVWGLVELATITANANGSVSANQQPTSSKPLIINVTGQQWFWTFEYPDFDDVASDVLVLPKDVPVYFNVTSKDVIHNFWAVELGIKIDANPGAVTETGVTPNKLGTFNIRCAELCGLHHAYMETQVKVVDQSAFDSWVREMGGGKTA